MLTYVTKYPVSFHSWKFGTGSVLLAISLLVAFMLVIEPADEATMIRTNLAMTTTIFLGGCVFIRNSVLPWSGSYFVSPWKPPSKRPAWRTTRQKLGKLDVLLMLSALILTGLLFVQMWPMAPSWQTRAYVLSGPAMFLMAVIKYAVQFMPDKAWIDNFVMTAGLLTGILFCLALGMQPI